MLEYVFEDSSGHTGHRISVRRLKATELQHICQTFDLLSIISNSDFASLAVRAQLLQKYLKV